MATFAEPCRRARRSRRGASPALIPLAMLAMLLAVASSHAGVRDGWPAALTHRLQPLATVPVYAAPLVDVAARRAEDEGRGRLGLPLRFAIPDSVGLSPADAGVWEDLDANWRVWRLRVASAGALSLNLGFRHFWLPEDARLCVYPAADPAAALIFDAGDNEAHGQLWTPVVPGDELVIELTVPRDGDGDWRLQLAVVNVGYRDFLADAPAKSGWCNIDVVCPEGDAWRDEIQTVARISTGSLLCTGFMVNNTARDARPLLMTADHCGITASNAAALVVYWNYQSPTCGQQGGGSLAQFQTGSTFLAGWNAALGTDFTLVELDDQPDTTWHVAYAGWNRGTADPSSAAGIHHPSGDEKSISFEDDPLLSTSYMDVFPLPVPYLRVEDWDAGTTEGGSSGSPLFDQNHYVVGQLYGGWASCDNDSSDYYGRFSVSWDGGGTPSTRLRDWLDPRGTRPVTLPLYAPYREPPPAPDSTNVLLPNVPNPFRTQTMISFFLERPGRARLSVHDLGGRLVRVLFDEERDAGDQAVPWDGLDGAGRRVPSGAYVLRLDGPGATVERKVMVAR